MSTSAPRVLLLGPLGTTAASWATTLPQLLALGVTAEPRDVPAGTVEDLHDAVERVLGPGTDRYVLAGVGFGGTVALAAALSRSERVAALHLVGSTAYPGNPAGWLDRAAAVRRDGLATRATAITERWSDDPLVRAQAAAVLAGIDPLAYASYCELAARIDLRDSLDRIEVPTRVLRAGLDTALPGEHSDLVAAGVRGATYDVLGSAPHLAMSSPEYVGSVAELVTSLSG